jgi:hypothetical protein
MLKTIDTRGWENNTAWCVPTTISFITGAPLIHTHSRAAFLQNISLKNVKGVYGSEACLLLHEQGYKSVPVDLNQKGYTSPPTLLRFLRDRTSYEQCMPLMIQIKDSKDFCHMIVSHYGYAADNHTMKPVEIEKFPHLRKYVIAAWIVSEK